MLAAIGLIIIIKQVPALLGDLAAPAKTMLGAIAELPASFTRLDPAVTVIGALCLFLMFYVNHARYEWLRRLPKALIVAVVGIVLGYLFDLAPEHRIYMPDDILSGGFTLPAFGDVWSRPELWTSVVLVVITLTLIDGIESLATIKAVDRIDPYQRKSHPNVTLRAMGVSNVLSSIAGGLTIIPGGIKSRANIDAGGRTLWANFYNAVFLTAFLFLAKDLITRIPLAAIGAVLVYVGWRLCEVRVFAKTYAIGRDQIVIFVFTIAAILASDLLTGILLGVAAEILLLLYLLTPSLRVVLTGRLSLAQALAFLWASFTGLFRSPVIGVKKETVNGREHYRVTLSSVVCFNLLPLDRVLRALPAAAGVTLIVTESGRIIDHTGMEYLHQFLEEGLSRHRPVEIQGLENFYQFTAHSLSARMRDAKLVREKAIAGARELALTELAARHGLEFAPAPGAVLNRHDFVYLRRGANRQESNVMTGRHDGCHVKVFDYSHTAAPDYYSEHRHTVLLLRPLDAPELALPDLAVTAGAYLERYLIAEYREVELPAGAAGGGRRLYARDPEAALAAYRRLLAPLLDAHPDLYVEIRSRVVLLFRPGRDRETPEEIERLLGVTAPLCRLAAEGEAE
jgi:carbonic anhydrase